MTTEDIIIHIFCHVDNALGQVGKDSCAKLYLSEAVTIGILFALKGGYFRAFYRWLKRDFDGLFGGLPDRTDVACQLCEHQHLTDTLLVEPSVLNVGGRCPMELIFPIREGRSKQQVDGKNKDKGRWSVGVNLCWVLNTLGQVCGWIWDTLNCPDNSFLDFLAECDQEGIWLTDWVFRCATGVPNNIKLCKKGPWNDRMVVETSFSLLTVVYVMPSTSTIVLKPILTHALPTPWLCSTPINLSFTPCILMKVNSK